MTDAEQLVAVDLLQVPIALWARAQEHSDELIREFMLIAAERKRSMVTHDVPQQLTALMDELTVSYGAFSEANEQRLAEAAAAQVESIDLHYEMPAAVAVGAQHLGELLDEADEFCRRGEHLLTLATPEPLLALRRWFLDEFVRQIEGKAPTAWPDYVGSTTQA